jgi:hypothetical protein
MEQPTSASSMNLSRRKFMGSVIGTAAILNGAFPLSGISENLTTSQNTEKIKFCIFSKHLHWLDYPAMAKTVAGVGFDGIDLTVRPEGHVLPENVEKDLPLAVVAAQKAGVEILTLTTAINDADDSLAQRVIKTASKSGIRYYRLGYFPYTEKTGIPEQLSMSAL